MTETTITQKINLDLPTVRKFLAEALAEKGADYVYPQDRQTTPRGDHLACRYLDYDAQHLPVGPSCIVGHVLVKAGVPMEDLGANEGRPAFRVLPKFFPGMSPVLGDALSTCQAEQDLGKPWGQAVAAFETVVSE